MNRPWSWRCTASPSQVAAAARAAGIYLEMAFDTIAGHALPMVVVEVHGEPWLLYPSIGNIPCWIAAKAMRVYDEWANICGTDGMLGPAGATAEQLISTLLSAAQLPADPNLMQKAILTSRTPDPIPDDPGDDTVPLARPPSRRRVCPACAGEFVAVGRQTYCCHACRQRAYTRRRSQPSVAPVAQLTRSSLTDHTVYECVQCGDQRLGEHRCQECNLMMRKIGLGAVCPSCDELLLLQELLEPIGLRVHQPILTRRPMCISS